MSTGYRLISIEEIADRYFSSIGLRSLIDKYVTTLSDYQRGYFSHLTQVQDTLPSKNFSGHNISTKRDNVFIWSDLYDIESLIWHFEQQKKDLLANSPAPDLALFVDKTLYLANKELNQLIESHRKEVCVHKEDKYGMHIQVYRNYIAFLEADKNYNESSGKKASNTVPPAVQNLPEQNQLADVKGKAIEYLVYLSGFNMHGNRIMQVTDYERLYEYTLHLINEEGVPNDISPIYEVDLPDGHIRYIYYLISRARYKPRHNKKAVYVDFLYKIFPTRFNEDKVAWHTTHTKFSIPPGSWNSDFKKMIGKTGK